MYVSIFDRTKQEAIKTKYFVYAVDAILSHYALYCATVPFSIIIYTRLSFCIPNWTLLMLVLLTRLKYCHICPNCDFQTRVRG